MLPDPDVPNPTFAVLVHANVAGPPTDTLVPKVTPVIVPML